MVLTTTYLDKDLFYPVWDLSFMNPRRCILIDSVNFSGIISACCLYPVSLFSEDACGLCVTSLAPPASPYACPQPLGSHSLRSPLLVPTLLPCTVITGTFFFALFSLFLYCSQIKVPKIPYLFWRCNKQLLIWFRFKNYQEQTPRIPLKNVSLENLTKTNRITFIDFSSRPPVLSVGSQPDLF